MSNLNRFWKYISGQRPKKSHLPGSRLGLATHASMDSRHEWTVKEAPEIMQRVKWNTWDGIKELDISIISVNANGLNFWLKDRDWQTDHKI